MWQKLELELSQRRYSHIASDAVIEALHVNVRGGGGIVTKQFLCFETSCNVFGCFRIFRISSRNDVGRQVMCRIVACEYSSFHGFLCLWGLRNTDQNCLSDVNNQNDVATCERDACEFS